MSREKNLVKNTMVLGIGNFLPKIVSIIILPILTAELTKAEYGTYDLIATLVMLLMPIATLQIQSAAFRFLIDCRNDKKKSADIISNIFIVTVPIAIIFSIIIQFFFGQQGYLIRSAISLYFLTDSLYLTSGQVTRGLGGNKNYAVASILVSVINMIGILIGVRVAEQGIAAVMISLAIANFMGGAFLFFKNQIFTYLSLKCCSVKTIRELLSYSWPMVPNNLSNWVLKLSDRLIITAALGVEANAVYAVACKIPNLLSLAQSVMVMAWQENASIAVKDKDADKYFSKMFNTIFCLMVGSTAILIGFTPIIFKVLIRGSYEDAYAQMPILILGMFFYCMSAFQGGIYVAHKKTKSVGVTTMVAAAINLVIDVIFVKSLGISAGSISTLVAYLFLYVFRMLDFQKFQPMDYHLKKQFLMMFVLVGMLVICFVQINWLNVVNVIIGLVTFVFLNKKLICKCITEFRAVLYKK